MEDRIAAVEHGRIEVPDVALHELDLVGTSASPSSPK